MRKSRLALFLTCLLLVAVGLLVLRFGGEKGLRPATPGGNEPSGASAPNPPGQSAEKPAGQAGETTHRPAGGQGVFSAEMSSLVNGIQAGRVVRVRVGNQTHDYLFRSKRITAEGFRISAGANAEHPAAFAVFEGRQILANGRLAGMAKLAIVNDTLSMVYATEAGDFLIEEAGEGKWVSRTLMSREKGSTWGHFSCASTSEISGVKDASGDSPRPPSKEAVISLAGDAANEPAIGGGRADHPYFRLGSQYDASLKDINILMVSSKSQTGTNLSSKAATYFTYAATAADVYERQLGLRYQLQELVLIPSNSAEADIEPASNVAENADDDLGSLRTWTQNHRPRDTYQWGHVAGWTLVDGNQGSKVGWAYIASYGSATFGFSVNEPEWTWGVLIHEIGHNVGANHTAGGAMNSTVSKSNPQESFFTENNTDGGGFTAAKEIYDYMSVPSRSFVTGPAPLRNPNQMPFGVDDAVSTAANTPVVFNPLTNDLTATPLFGTNNNLRLVEVGQVFPKTSGTAVVSGSSITFTPAAGFTGRAWFSYTLRGDVGNGGFGWMHSADVVVTVGGNAADPNQNPALSTTADFIETDFSGPIRLNPLLNDEGKGRLWAGGVDAVISVSGTAQSYSDGAFRLVSATVITGNGTVALETAEMTRDSLNGSDNTGYLVYTPGPNEPAQVVIQYTVEDANGNLGTGTIYLNFNANIINPDDTDDDGLLDGWEIRFFGNLNSGPTADPDNDGFDNLTEASAGTNPIAAAATVKASGTIIGTAGSYLNDPAWDKTKVFDGLLNTFYDALNATGDWAGLDLGTAKRIKLVKYAPRSGWASRMNGGQFQASNTADFSSGVVTFHTISGNPTSGILSQVTVSNTNSYRYVRYLGPANGYCNVAEVEFHIDGAPSAPTGLVANALGNGTVQINWQSNGESDVAGYKVYRSTTSGVFTYGSPLAANVATNAFVDSTAVAGTTYFYVVTAFDADAYESARSTEVSATPVVNTAPPVVDAGPNQSVVFVGGVPWTPADLTTTGWYDASDAATLTVTSGSVSQWADKSGNALHLSQTNGTQRPLTGGTINGLNAIDFDGSNDTLVTGSNPFAPTISDALVIAVHRIDSTANGTLFSLSGAVANSSRWQAHAPFGTTVYFDTGGAGSANRVSNSYGVAVGDNVLVGFYGSTTDSVQQIYKNGALLKGDTTGHSVATVGNLFVGSSENTQYQNTSIGEFLMIKGTVSAANRQKLEGYLAHKWGLAPGLPADHPYKAAAPGGVGVVVNLDGTMSDPDGGTPTTTWTHISGPAAVNFGNASAVDTTATFTEPGTYVLRFTANDGLYQSFDEVTITILPEGSVVDNDNDGIADDWEIEYFDEVGLIDGSADSDNDGVLDFFEYLYGSNPTVSSDSGFGVSVESDENDDMVFRWEVLEGFELGTHYEVRISTTLSTWDPLPAEHYTLQETTLSGRTSLELTLTHDYGNKVFLRLIQP